VQPFNHLLVIEDDPAVARSLQDGLQRNGYQVTWKDRGGAG
jgi:DNA-binding response OmpR family regulator